MKILRYLGCMIIGHNKILQHWLENENDTYFTVCSQCDRKWKIKQLSKQSQIFTKTHAIKIRSQGKIIQTSIVPSFKIPEKTDKKQLINIYLI
ncbi:MAG TPA: hypothetical protein VFG25_01070 [Nitrosopumilaceae archaeon]|nr:hypothetical protein [Nitrosopumilaceae archaeon]